MNERIKELRKSLGIKQGDFAQKVSTTQGHISDIENGRKDVSDRMIKIVCLEFNVNEEWLRSGKGKMFLENETFSFDQYAKQKNLSPLEKKIVKAYMDLSPETRKDLLETFQKAMEEIAEEITPVYDNGVDIEKELAEYKLELEAEKRGEISSALDNIEKFTKNVLPKAK